MFTYRAAVSLSISCFFGALPSGSHRLPKDCSFERAALAEPLSVLIHASRRAQCKAGQRVLVCGAGAIGLLACAVARSTGASRVVAIDINHARLDFAKSQGFADDVFCLPAGPRAKSSEEALRRAKETGATVLKAFGEEDGFDVIFECTGAEPCIQMSIHVSISFFYLSFPRTWN